MIYYLKADTRSALLAALGDLWDAEREQFYSPNPDDALVICGGNGTLYQGTGQFTTIDGMQVEQQEPIPGYHANLMLHGAIPASVEEIRIPKPASPKFVFAGVE